MKTSNAIKAMSSYPIPAATIENIIDEAGLDADADITREVRASNEFKKAKASHTPFLPKLRTSPRRNQLHINEDERSRFAKKSNSLLAELGEDEAGTDIPCGYIGEGLLMIIQNGFLFTYDTTGGGMLHGIPQKVETKLSDKGIPCNIVKNKSDHQGTIPGRQVQTICSQGINRTAGLHRQKSEANRQPRRGSRRV